VTPHAQLGVLTKPDSPAGSHLTVRVCGRRTLGVISTVPHWGLMSDVFGDDMAHQAPPQSVWISVKPHPECVLCGDSRVAPRLAALPGGHEVASGVTLSATRIAT
jgi:hypothetical protein